MKIRLIQPFTLIRNLLSPGRAKTKYSQSPIRWQTQGCPSWIFPLGRIHSLPCGKGSGQLPASSGRLLQRLLSYLLKIMLLGGGSPNQLSKEVVQGCSHFCPRQGFATGQSLLRISPEIVCGLHNGLMASPARFFHRHIPNKPPVHLIVSASLSRRRWVTLPPICSSHTASLLFLR